MENNTVEKLAEAYADSKERRGCSLWSGLYHGFMDGLKASASAGIKEDREVYVPVSVEKELPAKEGWYIVTSKHGFFMHVYFYNQAWNALVGTWLKKVKLSELIGGASDKKESV